MKISERGKKLIERLEGSELVMYLDAGGLPTIGVGHLLSKSELMSGKLRILGKVVRWHEGLTEQQCLDLLDQDLDLAELAVTAHVRATLAQHQFDALVSWVFNVGVGSLRDSTLLKLLNAGRYDQVPAQLRRWNKCASKVKKGLVNRREAEIAMWEGRS